MSLPGLNLEMLLGQGRPPTCNFLQGSRNTNTASTTHTYSGVNFGTPSGDRIIVVVAIAGGPPSGVFSGITIGGIAATISRNTRNASGTVIAIAYANVPTGDSGSVVLTMPSAPTGNGTILMVYEVAGFPSLAPASSFIDTASHFNQSVSAAGSPAAVIAGGTCYINGGGSHTWSGTAGIAEDYEAGGTQTLAGSSASVLNMSGVSGTVICTPVTINAAQMVGLVFQG